MDDSQKTTNELQSLRSVVDALSEYADRPAVLALRKEEIDRWSFAKLAAHVQRLAQGFKSAGAGKGACVGLLASPRPEWFVACLAAIRAGAVVVPLDVQLSDDVLSHVLKDSGCGFLCTTTDQLMRLNRLDLTIPHERQ